MPIRPVLLAFFVVVASHPANATKRSASSTTSVEATIRYFWSAAGTKDIAFTKSTYDFPVSLVEVSATQAYTKFIFTKRDFENEAKRQLVRVPLNARLSGFNIRIIAPNLVSVTYRMSIPRRTVSARVFAAQTLKMQTLLKKDTSWKIVYSTIPYNM